MGGACAVGDGNHTAVSIQFEFSPDELATKVPTQLVQKVLVEPMCSNFRWPDRFELESHAG